LSLQCFRAASTILFTAFESRGIPIDEHSLVPVVVVEREASVQHRLTSHALPDGHPVCGVVPLIVGETVRANAPEG
jgi:hypothetical protein